MRLWHSSPSVNPIFKHACAAIHWGYTSDFWSDPSSTSILYVCERAVSPEPSLFAFAISIIISWAGLFSFHFLVTKINFIWAPSSEFVSSSIPSWQISTTHAQPFKGARDLTFCLKVPLDSLLVWASSGGSGETARMRRLAWTFAARIGDKYQIRLSRSISI